MDRFGERKEDRRLAALGPDSSRCRGSARFASAGLLLRAGARDLPAVRETSDEDWLKKVRLCPRPFLDCLRQESAAAASGNTTRSPGQFPRSSDQGLARATEDRVFYSISASTISGKLPRWLPPNARAGGASFRAAPRSHQSFSKNLFLSHERYDRAQVKESLPSPCAFEPLRTKARFSQALLELANGRGPPSAWTRLRILFAIGADG